MATLTDLRLLHFPLHSQPFVRDREVRNTNTFPFTVMNMSVVDVMKAPSGVIILAMN
jgi:hypothetical protein